ncbi:hypothetical protein Taro_020655, partial [Colocasia esculenta]|nr:hypothetical protein [Colocasia esculenta]
SEKFRGKVRAFAPFRARRGGGSCPLPLRLRPQLTPSVRSDVSPQHRLRLAAEDSSPSLLSPSLASRRRKCVQFCSGSSQILFFPSSPVSPGREPLLEASAADSTHGVSSLCSSCLGCCLIVIDCYVNAYLFLPREENPNIFLNFKYVGAALKGYVQSCRDDKSKEQHFNYAFGKLDRAPNEFDLIFSPMHVGTNHWALLVIHIKEKEFHVYDSLRNKDRRDIPQYVEELKRYMKGKHIDADKWPLRYPDPCPQQGSGDDCGIFTCKYMECLARRDIQDFPFSQDDMPYVRAKFALHFIKAYFNAQERS